MKKLLGILVLGLLWCNAGNAGIKEPGQDSKCLKNGMKEFLKPEKEGGWPRNKIKDLRDVLRQDGAFREYFKQELNARGLKLPLKQEKLWIEKDEIMITLFHDMVELMDFYPETLLENE